MLFMASLVKTAFRSLPKYAASRASMPLLAHQTSYSWCRFDATKPVPMRRTDDVHDPDFWRARVRLIQYQVEEVLRFPLEKLRQVGSTLVPYYDEDQEGEQEDAAYRKRLPYVELIARFRG